MKRNPDIEHNSVIVRMAKKSLLRVVPLFFLVCCMLFAGALGLSEIAHHKAYASTAGNMYYSLGLNNYKINRMNLADMSDPQTIVQLDSFNEPHGIAVDSEGGYIYYAANRTYIYKLRLDTLQEVDRYSNENVVTNVSLDAERNKLYFTDGYSDGVSGTMTTRIRVLDLVDRSITTLHETSAGDLGFIYGLTVYPEGGYVYFYQNELIAGRSSIYRMRLDGTSVEAWIQPGNGSADIEIDPATDTLYFTDETFIRKANLSTGELQSVPVYSGSDWISHIARDPGDGTIYFGANDYSNMTGHIYRMISADEAELVVLNTGYINDIAIAEAPLTYTIKPIPDLTLEDLPVGYEPGTHTYQYVTLERTGTGVLQNVSASLNGPNADAFVITQPDPTIDAVPSSVVVKAKDGLAAGTYTATITVNADHMEPVSFNVTQVVHSYTVAPIGDQTLSELVSGYAAGTQETRSVAITRTGTGVLQNVSASLNGPNADAFVITQPDPTIDAVPSSVGVKAKDGLAAGTYTATITVNADHMEPVSFNVTQVVHPSAEARLGGLDIAPGSLTPAFDPDVTAYTANVPYTTDRVIVVASAYDANAEFVIYSDGEVITGPVVLKVGENRLQVKVTAENGVSDLTYNMDIVRAPSNNAAIRSLNLKGVTLNETVSADVYQYTASVANEVYDAYLEVEPMDVNASIGALTVNGELAANPVPFQVGSNIIAFDILAQDGVTRQAYTITVTREASGNARLSSLEISPGILSPVFDPTVYAYSAEVSYDTEAVSVTASVYHDNAQLKIDGQLYASGSPARILLDAGTTNVLLEVVAEDGANTANYTLSIQREANDNADLAALALSDGTLTPAFSADRRAYEAVVPNSVSHIAVTASVHDSNAVMKVNGIPVASGDSTAPIALEEGSNRITVEVTAQDGVTTKVYQIIVIRSGMPVEPDPDHRPSHNESRTYPGRDVVVEADQETSLFINGQSFDQIVTSTTTSKDGSVQVHLVVDANLLQARLEQEEMGADVQVLADQAADEVIMALSGEAVQALANKRALLLIQTPNGNYRLPTAELFIDRLSELAEQIGQSELADIVVQIAIVKSGKVKNELLDREAGLRGLTVLSPPVEFTVTVLHNGVSTEVSRFDSFVRREIPVSTEVDYEGVMTAVVLEEDGQLRHVPTYSSVRDGTVYAVIHSMTNSTYALVGNLVRFSDIEAHWSQTSVNELASRLILNGVDQDQEHFLPDAAITRAEFTAIVIRALGLPVNDKKALFHDVQLNEWYAGAVTAANDYGIIQGYEDGTFRPVLTITRQEAMVIISRAMSLTGLDMMEGHELYGHAPSKHTPDEHAIEDLLSAFADGAQVQAWAKEAAAATIHYGLINGYNGELRPTSNLTRAETAWIAHRLLGKAGLIDY